MPWGAAGESVRDQNLGRLTIKVQPVHVRMYVLQLANS